MEQQCGTSSDSSLDSSGMRLRLDEQARRSLGDCLNAGGDSKFAARVVEMEIDSALTEPQNLGDFRRSLTARRPRECFDFALGERDCLRRWRCIDTSDAGQARDDQGSQHLEINRLGDVIIGAEPPSFELVVPIRQRGEKDEWDVGEFRPARRQVLEQLEPGHDGHINVSEDEIRGRLAQTLQSKLPVVGHSNLIAAIGEIFGNQCSRFVIVLYTQNALGDSFHNRSAISHLNNDIIRGVTTE
jgi:hypothetical protein